VSVPPPNDLDQEWQRLWALAERLAAPTGDDPAYAFYPVGLALHSPAKAAPWEPWDDPSTPTNSTIFASTGGDGVHFGMLHHPGTTPRAAPIVMTVPMAFSDPNHVVGASLREFLALGSRTGYWHLERLAYGHDRPAEIGWLQDAELPAGTIGWDGPGGPDPVEVLAALRLELDLEPWPRVEERLAELRARYLPAVRPPEQG
jgi:hypothetical protein